MDKETGSINLQFLECRAPHLTDISIPNDGFNVTHSSHWGNVVTGEDKLTPKQETKGLESNALRKLLGSLAQLLQALTVEMGRHQSWQGMDKM